MLPALLAKPEENPCRKAAATLPRRDFRSQHPAPSPGAGAAGTRLLRSCAGAPVPALVFLAGLCRQLLPLCHRSKRLCPSGADAGGGWLQPPLRVWASTSDPSPRLFSLAKSLMSARLCSTFSFQAALLE